MPAYEVVTPPTSLPVKLATAKDYLDYLSNEEDAEITALIERATRHVEELAGVRLMQTTIKEYRDRFPRRIELAVGPVSSVTEITYTDETGATQTLNPSNYRVDTVSVPARIAPEWNLSWPLSRRQFNSIAITYNAGHASRDNVPKSAIQLILLFTRRWFDNCEGALIPDSTIHNLLLDLKGWANG